MCNVAAKWLLLPNCVCETPSGGVKSVVKAVRWSWLRQRICSHWMTRHTELSDAPFSIGCMVRQDA